MKYHLTADDHFEFSLRAICCIDGSVQERRNSIANALELRLSRSSPSIFLFHFHWYVFWCLLQYAAACNVTDENGTVVKERECMGKCGSRGHHIFYNGQNLTAHFCRPRCSIGEDIDSTIESIEAYIEEFMSDLEELFESEFGDDWFPFGNDDQDDDDNDWWPFGDDDNDDNSDDDDDDWWPFGDDNDDDSDWWPFGDDNDEDSDWWPFGDDNDDDNDWWPFGDDDDSWWESHSTESPEDPSSGDLPTENPDNGEFSTPKPDSGDFSTPKPDGVDRPTTTKPDEP